MSKARNQQLRRYNEARKIKARASRVGRVYKASRTESAKLLPLPCIDLAGASVPAVLELLKLRHGARLLWVGCGGAVEAVAVALELGRIVASFELVEQQPAAIDGLSNGSSVRNIPVQWLRLMHSFKTSPSRSAATVRQCCAFRTTAQQQMGVIR